MHPDPQPTPGARDPRQPGPPAPIPPVGPGHIPHQQGYARPPAPIGPTGHPLAGFGDRFLAYLIDSLIVGVIAFALYCPVTIFMILLPLTRDIDEGRITGGTMTLLVLGYATLVAIQIILGYLYFVEYQLRSGQTAGKRVMSLRVLPVQPDQRLDRGILVRRYLVQFVAGSFVPFLGLIDGLWQLWDQPLQQTLHDKAAETLVAKVVQ
ncbi:RDD family protein [Asanoa sp. WMMD1127]|uniref:RDD family protein n=1 Tax=Asanoa sp. WMMD1127 TaxID=3016107 RepID=UPI002416C1D5|nr:RDD family protein [Asanoa sp. WMMD1127]MDG4822467.1 RDD family protein [Asanoa sp. WMMD1127]